MTMAQNAELRQQWKAFIEGNDAIAEELANFVDFLGLERIVPGRYSRLLVLQLFGGMKANTQGPEKILHEIKALETGVTTGLKSPIQNKHPPLKGLWHKHYLQDGLQSLAQNVRLAYKRYESPHFQQKLRETEAAGEQRFMTADDIREIANDVVHGNLRRRFQTNSMTGEWLVFAEHQGNNYYLTLAEHDSDTHPDVRSWIDAICCVEFPWLIELLENA